MIEANFGGVGADAKSKPLYFRSPARTLTANRLEEICPLLEAAHTAAKFGSWVALLLSYEAAPAFDPAMKTRGTGPLPLAWAAIFNEPEESPEHLASQYEVGRWTPLVSRTNFGAAIDNIRERIAQGDTYQVNYTFPLVASFKGDARSWYRDLCLAQGAGYCAYFDLGRFKILSVSPELFFELADARTIRTRPMKGTIKRGRWPAEDESFAQALAASPKDRAENVMIVDLLRNDLGRVSVPGTVQVPRLFDVERFETLWQMTSTVEAILKTDIGLPQVLASLFPCGSITGAPKISTMEIIRELEPHPRGIYTGTLGFLRPGGDAVFNVAIRTVVIDSERGEATFGVGGGITFDSTADREYEECLVKSAFLKTALMTFQLLESCLLKDGNYFLLVRHLERMKASAAYFGFRFDESRVDSELERVAASHGEGNWKVRMLLSRHGEVRCDANTLEPSTGEPLRVALATEAVDENDKFLFHKTTNRVVYEQAFAACNDCDDVILWNRNGEITESTVANVVVANGDELFTPPQSAGLLAGTFRAELLAAAKIKERVIRREELQQGSKLFLINSVHKWREAVVVR